MQNRIALVGKSVRFIQDQQIEPVGIAVELVGRTDDQIRFGLLGITLTNRDHRQVWKRVRQPPRQLQHHLPPGDRNRRPLSPLQPPPQTIHYNFRFSRAAHRIDQNVVGFGQFAQLIGDLLLIRSQGIIQPQLRIQRFTKLGHDWFLRLARQPPGKADAAAAVPALAAKIEPGWILISAPRTAHNFTSHL